VKIVRSLKGGDGKSTSSPPRGIFAKTKWVYHGLIHEGRDRRRSKRKGLWGLPPVDLSAMNWGATRRQSFNSGRIHRKKGRSQLSSLLISRIRH